jgi:hypothetical protein
MGSRQQARSRVTSGPATNRAQPKIISTDAFKLALGLVGHSREGHAPASCVEHNERCRLVADDTPMGGMDGLGHHLACYEVLLVALIILDRDQGPSPSLLKASLHDR